MVLLEVVLVGIAAVLSLPVLVFAVEVASAVGLGAMAAARWPVGGQRPRLAVLVPAHNESRGILPTLADIRARLAPGDRLLVIADNCSDDTAEVAHGAGAEVIERHDGERRGKGYALDFGLRHLASDPPEVVIMVDADCRLGENALATLAACSAASGRPAQALYAMQVPEDGKVNQRVSAFAWIVKTHVRPLGLWALGLPCQLMGTGMALPWRAALAVDLASDNLVEDMKLGLDLVGLGYAPLLCPCAKIESVFPCSADATLTQHRRWEIGSFRIIRSELSRSLAAGMRRRDLALLALVIDALVPPISALAGLLLLALAVTGSSALLGASSTAPLFLALAIGLMAVSLLFAWICFGRDVLPAREFVHILGYLSQKRKIYNPTAIRRMSGWIRTRRD